MATLYILNKNPEYSYKELDKYGEEKYFMTRGIVNINPSDFNHIYTKICSDLDGFNPTTDYLVLGGAVVLNVLAYKYLNDRFPNTLIKTLFWHHHNNRQQYSEISI